MRIWSNSLFGGQTEIVIDPPAAWTYTRVEPFVVMHPDDFNALGAMPLPKDKDGRYLVAYRATDDPAELPDKDIVPDETPPLEDEPVKTDPVPEE